VSYKAETPFDNIEGSHEYVALLAESLAEALLVSYNLAKLNLHITSSRRILNDLRTLRRLLLKERGLPVEEESEVAAGDGF
jgi:hypothetical protein